jgi:hypothetical protein
MHILHIPSEIFNDITSYLSVEESRNLLVSHRIICIKLLNNGLTVIKDSNNLISVDRIKYLPRGLLTLDLHFNRSITDRGLQYLPRGVINSRLIL